MTWGFVTETSELTNNVDKTCWISVAIVIGLIILVFVMNDLCMKKYNKTKKTVKFEEDEYEEDYNKVNKIMNKRQCNYNK
jgi:flagellar biosynthesis protein FliP